MRIRTIINVLIPVICVTILSRGSPACYNSLKFWDSRLCFSCHSHFIRNFFKLRFFSLPNFSSFRIGSFNRPHNLIALSIKFRGLPRFNTDTAEGFIDFVDNCQRCFGWFPTTPVRRIWCLIGRSIKVSSTGHTINNFVNRQTNVRVKIFR